MEVLTLETNDHPAVKMLDHQRRPSLHPPGGIVDCEALALPTDEVAVVDRPLGLQTEDLFEIEALG